MLIKYVRIKEKGLGIKSVVSVLSSKMNTQAQVYSRLSAQVANFKFKGYVHRALDIKE